MDAEKNMVEASGVVIDEGWFEQRKRICQSKWIAGVNQIAARLM